MKSITPNHTIQILVLLSFSIFCSIYQWLSISTVNPTDTLEHAQQFGGSFVIVKKKLFWSTSYLVGYYLDGVEGPQCKDFL